MMTVTKFDNPIDFEIEEVLTHGVCNGKYGGYCVPIRLEPDGDLIEKLKGIAGEHNAQAELYGADKSTMYLRCDQLSPKQKGELLNKGRMIVCVGFASTGTRTKKDGVAYLNMELTRLTKVRAPELRPAPSD